MIRILGIIVVLIHGLCAKSTTEKIGDFFTVAIPAIAYGSTFYFDDEEGREEFYKSYGVTMVSTVILKHTIRQKRPDSNERDSFPSGHTSSAVSGAVFVHKRYGLAFAIPLYLGAIYTGYSRIQVNRHYPKDVVAGAVFGAVTSWYFTSEYKGIEVIPQVSEEYQGMQFRYKF